MVVMILQDVSIAVVLNLNGIDAKIEFLCLNVLPLELDRQFLEGSVNVQDVCFVHDLGG